MNVKSLFLVGLLASLRFGQTAARAQSTNASAYIWTTLAGHASAGAADGVGSSAQFNQPQGVAIDTNGNLFVADTYNHTIRKISPAGVVKTIAGFPGSYGTNDGSGGSARFYFPQWIAADSQGNVFVTGDDVIRKLTPLGSNWEVTTIVGQPGVPGTNDGPGLLAHLRSPSGIAADDLGNLYVCDTGNYTIRRVTPDGTNWVVNTIAGSPGVQGRAFGTNALFANPTEIAVDHALNLYVKDCATSNEIRRISSDGSNWWVDFWASGPSNSLNGIAADTNGFVYETVMGGYGGGAVLMVSPGSGVVTTVAGQPGVIGASDGIGTNALFYGPWGIALDRVGNLYVADRYNNSIRKVTSAWVVRTIAGSPAGAGSSDGHGGEARFNGPSSVAVDGAGNVYVADSLNNTIRQITSAGEVFTLAGSPGIGGTNDGVASSARFLFPSGVAADSGGNVYVADAGNYTIRMVTQAGVVSTIAGQPGTFGFTDGPGSVARFTSPNGIAVDAHGTLFVADGSDQVYFDDSRIRQIQNVGGNWFVSTLLPSFFGSAVGMAVDGGSNLWVSVLRDLTMPSDAEVLRFAPAGTNWTLTTVAFLAGTYAGPAVPGIGVDTAGSLYVADSASHLILKMRPGTNSYLNAYANVIGGAYHVRGSADGAGGAATFSSPVGIAADALGNVFVAEAGNNTIRKGVLNAYAATNPVPQTPQAMDGQLSVTTLPAEASGQWRFPWELGWHRSGETVSNLVTGASANYQIQLRAQPGWLAIPSSLAFQLPSGGLTTLTTNVYYPTFTPSSAQGGAGSLAVNLGATPPAGAGWRFLGDTTPYLPSGYNTNLLPGAYLIEFAGPFNGRVTPPNASVQVFAGQPTVISVNYFLAASPPVGVLLPQAVEATNINDLTDYPFGFNGQLETDVGYGSGVAVQPNVVLTAAHLVFNDQSLSYVGAAWWFIQQEAGVCSPLPTQARAFYVLSGYAAQRTNDLLSGLYGPDQSTPQSRNLDVAALYFDSYVANGGYGGYLPSDATPNSWLASTSLKMLVGYPVDGSLFGDASIVAGQMYQTQPQPYPLSIASDPNVANQQVYTAPWFLSYPGNSGGPLFVQFNGYFYPAGVYLGTLYSGTQPYASAVRAINSDVVNLIAIAQADAGTGTNNTGGGVITIIPAGVSASNPGYVQLQLGPAAAVWVGAAWRLSCANCDTNWSVAANYTLAVTTTNALSVQFKPIPGWNLPTNESVSVSAGQLTAPGAIYTDQPAMLSYKIGEGLRLFGASGLAYRIEYATDLNSPASWAPLATVTNPVMTNTTVIFGTQPAPGTRFFRAAKAQ